MASGIDLDSLFGHDLLWALAGDAVELLEGRVNDKRSLVNEIACAVSISKKDKVDLVHQSAAEVKEVRRKSEVNRRESAERNGKIKELILKKR